MLLVIFIEI